MNACPKCGKFHEGRSHPRTGLPFAPAQNSLFGAYMKPKKRRRKRKRAEYPREENAKKFRDSGSR